MTLMIVAISLVQQMKDWPTMMKGFFIAGSGLVGVFLVLVLFYLTIRSLEKALRAKSVPGESEETD